MLQKAQNGHIFYVACRNHKLLCCYCLFALGRGKLTASFTKVQPELWKAELILGNLPLHSSKRRVKTF